MPRRKEYPDQAARQRAYRERQREQKVDESLPSRQLDEPDSALGDSRLSVEPAAEAGLERSLDVLLALDPLAPLSDFEELLLREHFGYAASETRSRAERARAAGVMLERAPQHDLAGVLGGLAISEQAYAERKRAYLDRKIPAPSR